MHRIREEGREKSTTDIKREVTASQIQKETDKWKLTEIE